MIEIRSIFFPNTLDVRFHYYNTGVIWELLAPFYAILNENTPEQHIIRVPAGQLTDFASVPRIPLFYLIYANKFHVPALVHDFLYSLGGLEEDRKFADKVFLAGMLALVDDFQTKSDAEAMYFAVRNFGEPHFNYISPTA